MTRRVYKHKIITKSWDMNNSQLEKFLDDEREAGWTLISMTIGAVELSYIFVFQTWYKEPRKSL